MEEAVHVWWQGVYEKSVPSQFYFKFNSVLQKLKRKQTRKHFCC